MTNSSADEGVPVPVEPVKTQRAELALLAILSAMTIWVVWPYAAAVFWAVVLAILLDGPWQWIQRNIKAPRAVQAILAILGVLLLVLIPLMGIVAMLPSQLQVLTDNLPELRDKFVSGLSQLQHSLPAYLADEVNKVIAANSNGSGGLMQIGSILSRMASWLSSVAVSTISVFVMGMMALYVLFYFFIDGRRMFGVMRSYLPFNQGLTDLLAMRIIEIVKSTVGGVFIIAAAQGVVCGAILALLGVGPVLVFAVLTTLASLIPAIGSGLVWVPVAIYLISQGEVAKGVILLLSGIFIISMVDNLLRPRLVGRGTRIPDFLILLTTLGGLDLMGAVGIVIGPMIAGLCLSMWQAVRANDAGGIVPDAAA
ncbi:MAG: AI-2E family transporter [Proteobacteria bacterium]|nr:AI-2E family transporter [Pseudomonadota bacterium]